MSATFKLMKGMGLNAIAKSTECVDWVVKFFNIDTCNAAESDYPINRPDDGGVINANHSYENWIFLYMTQAPENQVTNFRLWGPAPQSGNPTYPGNGIEIYLATAGYYAGDTPTDANTMCNKLAINHYSPGTALNFTGTCKAVGHSSGFFVMQMRVYASANMGNVEGEGCIYHLSYDES